MVQALGRIKPNDDLALAYGGPIDLTTVSWAIACVECAGCGVAIAGRIFLIFARGGVGAGQTDLEVLGFVAILWVSDSIRLIRLLFVTR